MVDDTMLKVVKRGFLCGNQCEKSYEEDLNKDMFIFTNYKLIKKDKTMTKFGKD
jgi:hypothetical protein